MFFRDSAEPKADINACAVTDMKTHYVSVEITFIRQTFQPSDDKHIIIFFFVISCYISQIYSLTFRINYLKLALYYYSQWISVKIFSLSGKT